MKPEAVNNQRRTILHVIDGLNYGGAQRLLALLAEWTPKDLYKTIICVLQPGEELKEHIESRGVQVFCLNRPRPSIFRPHQLSACVYRNVRDIMQLCKREEVDVIHCHLLDADFIGVIAGSLCGVERIISTVHGLDLLPSRNFYDPRNFLIRLAVKRIYRLTHYIIAVSDEVAKYLTETFFLNPAKIHVVINRIDVESFSQKTAQEQLRASLGLRSEQRVITAVGRLTAQKGHTYLISAVHRLVRDFGEIKLLLAGEGILREQLESQCKALGLAEQVCFLGGRRDVADILALTEIFVLPSIWEGTSLALLEAMAAGKPIVATDVQGNRALLKHEQSALLVPPEDAEALAEAIAFLLKHLDSACRYGYNAHEAARKQFDIRQTISELEQIWGKPGVSAQ